MNGRKTYITGTVTIIGAVCGWYLGQVSLADALAVAIPALMLMTTRHGVSTELTKRLGD